MAKLTAQKTIKVTQDEQEELDMLKQKGISLMDCFRRGKDGYMRDIFKGEQNEKTI